MIQMIQNDKLTVLIKQKGAELTSIRSLADNTEYLWQGGANLYRPQAQFLFPIIGFTDNDEVRIEGRTYKMPPHGFAKDQIFRVTHSTADAVTLECAETEETLKAYPFRFSLSIGYRLEDNELDISYRIRNSDSKPLRFSIGHHPGFSCPIERQLRMSDYRMEFSETEDLRYNVYSYADKALTETERDFLRNDRAFPLSHEVLAPGPIVLKGLRSDTITIRSDKGARSLAVRMKGIPYCSIWSSPKPADFVCIQPWHGTLARRGESNDLSRKEGMRPLEPGATFESSYRFVMG